MWKKLARLEQSAASAPFSSLRAAGHRSRRRGYVGRSRARPRRYHRARGRRTSSGAAHAARLRPNSSWKLTRPRRLPRSTKTAKARGAKTPSGPRWLGASRSAKRPLRASPRRAGGARFPLLPPRRRSKRRPRPSKPWPCSSTSRASISNMRVLRGAPRPRRRPRRERTGREPRPCGRNRCAPRFAEHPRERARAQDAALGPLARDGLDAVLLEDLGRQVRAAVLVLPIVVRGRAVALLYGDHGAHPVEYNAVGDVVAIAPLSPARSTRIIVHKKLAAFRTPAAKEIDPETNTPSASRTASRRSRCDRQPYVQGCRAGASSSTRGSGPSKPSPIGRGCRRRKTSSPTRTWSTRVGLRFPSRRSPRSTAPLAEAVYRRSVISRSARTAIDADRAPTRAARATRTAHREVPSARERERTRVCRRPAAPDRRGGRGPFSTPPIPREDTSVTGRRSPWRCRGRTTNRSAPCSTRSRKPRGRDIPFPITR